MEELNTCGTSLELMTDWVKNGSDEFCRPCILSPTVAWYIDELEDAGMHDKAKALEKMANDGDPLTICQELDKIKIETRGYLENILKGFDCQCQSFARNEEHSN